jgi:hypothetical protein
MVMKMKRDKVFKDTLKAILRSILVDYKNWLDNRLYPLKIMVSANAQNLFRRYLKDLGCSDARLV